MSRVNEIYGQFPLYHSGLNYSILGLLTAKMYISIPLADDHKLLTFDNERKLLSLNLLTTYNSI